jgi:small nuclear ribonucleoprotein (snRNP)-like protein
MKRITLLLATAFCVIVLASCKKDPAWERFWGFTKDDIVGHYVANPDESLYEELPTEGVKVYDNAVIDITSLSGNLISIKLNIPDVLNNKTFSGTLYSADDNSDIVLLNGNEDIQMTVYKNEKGLVRLHGREKHYHYDANHVLVSSENYGFDVIKE